ncbi:hypothetical protein ONS95_010728 [Cadophora gregata]|uniref:uncharacterized protein n=1 Tax=Cadophora gregata TaxID=51156 RepID=UPI0026DD8E66|nr:uncharacterized protein ONS95_010728 [Cadophora gregata]KAK0122498.1 hypothetical protein ONS95_010728 [Cadophora gregata]KAK0127978.1 hypothetical protein ONS96_007472 [Cadophora gregata f. sp. sojae]
MRICLLQSSYDDWPEAPYAQYDPLASPSHYISLDAHVFENRFICKATAKQDIKRVVEEKFDVYCNFMWGGATGPVAGDEEYELLAKTGVFIMIRYPPLSLLDKLQFNDLCSKDSNLHLPSNTPGKFPKICKYTDSCSSHNLHDLCHNDKEVEDKIVWMKSLEPTRDVFTQDYIFGDECSAMVIELGNGNVIALTPLEYLFPNTKDTEAFLSFEKKFDGVEQGKVLYGFVTDEPRRSKVQAAAIATFNACRDGQPGCWASVDIRYERSSGKPYVIEIGNLPVVFYPPRNTLGDDLVVEKTFPGGQPALFDLMLLSRHQQLGKDSPLTELHGTVEATIDAYDNFTRNTGVTYNSILDCPYYAHLRDIFLQKFSFEGREVLDLGCGTGCVVCFETFQFLHPVEFNATVARMFQIACKSVSFTIADLSETTIEKHQREVGFRQFNLMETVRRFGTPPGWKLLMNEKQVSYISPTTGEENSDLWLHFERDEEWVPTVPKIDFETHLFVE